MITRTAANPSLPSIFLVADSTADYNGTFAEEGAGIQGWGVFLPGFFDLSKVKLPAGVFPEGSTAQMTREAKLNCAGTCTLTFP